MVHIESGVIYLECKHHIAACVAHLHLRSGIECSVGHFGAEQTVLKETHGVDCSARYGGGIAVKDAIVIFHRHEHVAVKVLVGIIEIHRVAPEYHIVFVAGVFLHFDIRSERVGVQVEVEHAVLSDVVASSVKYERFEIPHLVGRYVIECRLYNQSGGRVEQSVGHFDTGLDVGIVAFDFDVGRLGGYGLEFAFGLYEHLIKSD